MGKHKRGICLGWRVASNMPQLWGKRWGMLDVGIKAFVSLGLILQMRLGVFVTLSFNLRYNTTISPRCSKDSYTTTMTTCLPLYTPKIFPLNLSITGLGSSKAVLHHQHCLMVSCNCCLTSLPALQIDIWHINSLLMTLHSHFFAQPLQMISPLSLKHQTETNIFWMKLLISVGGVAWH